MEGRELVEIIKIPFFNYFYSRVFRDSETYGSVFIPVSYGYMPVLLPVNEKLGVLRVESRDKFSRVQKFADPGQPLSLVRLSRRGSQDYVSAGDPVELELPDDFLKAYLSARNLWMSLERPSFDVKAGRNSIAFNLKSQSKGLQIFSSRLYVAERYALSIFFLPVRITRKSIEKFISLYPRNFGRSPPKFYSVNCTAFRLNSKGKLEEIPVDLMFEEKDFFGYKNKINDGIYFIKLALISDRSFEEVNEPNYNVVLEVLNIDPYLASVYYGTTEGSESLFYTERMLRGSVKHQLEMLLGENFFNGNTEVAKYAGIAEMQEKEEGVRIRTIKLSVISGFLHLYVEGQNRRFCEEFLRANQKIEFLATLQDTIDTDSMYLPKGGELMSRSLKLILEKIIRRDS